MKKSAYKSRGGSSFRTYFHGNRKTNGCNIRKVAKPADDKSKEGQA